MFSPRKYMHENRHTLSSSVIQPQYWENSNRTLYLKPLFFRVLPSHRRESTRFDEQSTTQQRNCKHLQHLENNKPRNNQLKRVQMQNFALVFPQKTPKDYDMVNFVIICRKQNISKC